MDAGSRAIAGESCSKLFYSLVGHELQRDTIVRCNASRRQSTDSRMIPAFRSFLSWPQAAACVLVIALLAIAPVARADEVAPLNARLLAAARSADAKGLQRALNEGAAINSRNRIGDTALLIVIKNHHSELAETLIRAGADVNIAGVNGVTPLMAAAFSNEIEIARQLLARGANFQATDRVKKNAMIYAAGEGNAQIVALLLEAGVDPNETYANDLTALMWAAGYGKTEAVRTLLKAGARPDMRDNRGKTALDIARDGRHDDTITVLESVTPPG
jgi:uncharacterized protein